MPVLGLLKAPLEADQSFTGRRFGDDLRVLEYDAPNHVDSSPSAGTLVAVSQSASSISEFVGEAMPFHHASKAA